MARWTEQFIPIDNSPAGAGPVDSRELLLRAGFIREIAPGSYVLLPLAQQVRTKIKEIIRRHVHRIAAQELHLPLAISPENEPAPFDPLRHVGSMSEILAIARATITSTRQLPQRWFHIGPVAGGSGRSSAGLLRMREEMMFEGFSIDRDRAGIDDSFQDFIGAIAAALAQCGVRCLSVESLPEQTKNRPTVLFVAPVDSGDRIVAHCENCGYTVPVAGASTLLSPGELLDAGEEERCARCGSAVARIRTVEIARLGEVDPRLDALSITTAKGNRKSLAVGSYRIAVDRLIAMVVEQWSDERGIVWPDSISPFQVIVAPVVSDRLVRNAAERLCSLLEANGFSVLFDNRDVDAALKAGEGDMIGIPWRITMGEKTREGTVEIVCRSSGTTEEVILDDIIDRLGQVMEENVAGSALRSVDE
jgi:prolyl-tRNA synthetase